MEKCDSTNSWRVFYSFGGVADITLGEKISQLCSHLQSAPSPTCQHPDFSPLNLESAFYILKALSFATRNKKNPLLENLMTSQKWHNIILFDYPSYLSLTFDMLRDL